MSNREKEVDGQQSKIIDFLSHKECIRNQRIYEVLDTLLQMSSSVKDGSKKAIVSNPIKAAVFTIEELSGEQILPLFLSTAKHEQPVLVLEFIFPNNDRTTSHGTIPSLLKDGDGDICWIRNVYFFDSTGNALKREMILPGIYYPVMTEHKEKSLMQFCMRLPKGQRDVHLNHWDYEKIETRLLMTR